MEDNKEQQEMHPAVQLLLARMNSHPDEFAGRGNNRWDIMYSDINQVASPYEKKAMKAKLREIKMDRIHKEMMERLLKVDEQEEDTYTSALSPTIQRLTTLQQQQQALLQQQYADAQQYRNAYPWSTSALTMASASQLAPSLQIGNEKLDEGIIRKIKKAAGL